ncbi:MAG: hypothetical protein JST94_12605 [Bacteroidetes bacterium]|nr:hypothetical protein [Bacteroidota bacterium]MBS1672268.1 hypothetical protein [Bacteroidota bacterium]
MQVNEITPTGKFTKAQLDLLKLFSKDMPDETWVELRHVISQHFANKATAEIDKIFEENNWGQEKIEEWSKEHMRTPYSK